MPKRKPDAEPEFQDESILSDEPNEKKWGGARPRKPKITLPINDEGVIDMARVRDPALLEKARAALGMSAGSTVEAAVDVPKIPREYIPHLYDGLAWLFGWGCQKAKWPRILTAEEMKVFRANLKYSDTFKEKASEPTAALIEKHVGNSRLAKWLMEHSELALLGQLLAAGTVEMMQNAAKPIMTARIIKQEVEKANGGFPASENRPVGEEAFQ